jgi:hypothetical protein
MPPQRDGSFQKPPRASALSLVAETGNPLPCRSLRHTHLCPVVAACRRVGSSLARLLCLALLAAPCPLAAISIGLVTLPIPLLKNTSRHAAQVRPFRG